MAGSTTSNPGSGETDLGGAVSYGAMVGGPLGSKGVPTQQTHSAVIGAYIGGGAQFGITDAGSMHSLSGSFSTLSFNIGLGELNFGASLSWSGSIFQLTITAPIVSGGVGVAASYTTTTTKVATFPGSQHGPC